MGAVYPLTLEEYERLIEAGAFHGRGNARFELIYGRILATAAPECNVERAVDLLLNGWIRQLRMPADVWIRIRSSLVISRHQSMVEPDIVWIAKPDGSKPRPDAHDVFLLIEAAEGWLSYDRGEKANLYASAGVNDYWIVNLEEQCVEVHREPRDGRYQSVESFSSGAEVRPLAFPELALPVALMFPHQ